MIIERTIGIITDNLELTAESDAPAVLTALANAKKPRKKKSPSTTPKKNVSVE